MVASHAAEFPADEAWLPAINEPGKLGDFPGCWNGSDILRNYPGLSHDDLAACLAYARDVLRSEKAYPSAA